MLDHIGIGVKSVRASRAFYLAALEPLGIGIIMEFGDEAVGFGTDGKPYFWFGASQSAGTPTHVAFVAKDRKTVDAFYKAAMAAGGKDNGPPGIRAHYHPNYYGAFVHDLDGHNVEAVCHLPE